MPTQTTQDTARTAARAIIQATTHQAAAAIAERLRGAQLAAVAQLLGVHLHGRVADRRHQLVQHTVGVALTHTVIGYNRDPEGGAAYLARWRARRLAQLDG